MQDLVARQLLHEFGHATFSLDQAFVLLTTASSAHALYDLAKAGRLQIHDEGLQVPEGKVPVDRIRCTSLLTEITRRIVVQTQNRMERSNGRVSEVSARSAHHELAGRTALDEARGGERSDRADR